MGAEDQIILVAIELLEERLRIDVTLVKKVAFVILLRIVGDFGGLGQGFGS